MYDTVKFNLSENNYIINYLAVPNFYLKYWFSFLSEDNVGVTKNNKYKVYISYFTDYLHSILDDKSKPVFNQKGVFNKRDIYLCLELLDKLSVNKDSSVSENYWNSLVKSYGIFMESLAVTNLKSVINVYNYLTNDKVVDEEDILGADKSNVTYGINEILSCVSEDFLRLFNSVPCVKFNYEDDYNEDNSNSNSNIYLNVNKSSDKFIIYSVGNSIFNVFKDNLLCLNENGNYSLLKLLNRFYRENKNAVSMDYSVLCRLILDDSKENDIELLKNVAYRSLFYLAVSYSDRVYYLAD